VRRSFCAIDLERLHETLGLRYGLKAPMQNAEGQLQARDKCTPQGGVVSPILANLFLHNAFDLWVMRRLPGVG